MKKLFFTGLVILLPLALTLAILTFFINFLTNPFMGLFRSIFEYFNLLETDFLFLSANQLQYYVSKALILFFLVFLTLGLGAVARWYFFRSLIRLWDYTLRRIPLVRTIYKLCQDIINTLFTDQKNSFKKVVLVPFPPNAKSLGFVSSQNTFTQGGCTTTLVAVFVPTTPNPTSGFLMMFSKEELIPLDMKVEDAFKYVVSCGVVTSNFNPTNPL